MHLQDAWYSEKDAVAATLTEMGYTAPPENVFGYGYAVSGTKGTWTATSKTGLDECGEGNTWTVESQPNGTNGSVLDHKAAANGGDNCVKLTPSFSKIGGSGV